MEISRRSLITGLVGLIAAPAIVRAENLMPVRLPLVMRKPMVFGRAMLNGEFVGDWQKVADDMLSFQMNSGPTLGSMPQSARIWFVSSYDDLTTSQKANKIIGFRDPTIHKSFATPFDFSPRDTTGAR